MVATTIGRAQTVPTGRRWNRDTTDNFWAAVFIGPQVIGLIAFSAIPLGSAMYLSLTNWDGFGNQTFVGLNNFIEQVQSPDLHIALWNTLVFTIIAVPGGLILALLVATALSNIGFKTFYRLLYFMPVVTSSVAVSVIWLYLLNNDFGIINTNVKTWTGIELPNWLVDSHWVMPTIAFMAVWQGLGYSMVIFLAGLANIPVSVKEAAMIDGANKLEVFRHVTLPLLSPTTFFLTITALISSFQVFDPVFVMTDGGPGKASYTMVFHVYKLGFRDFTFGKSASAAMILFAIILCVTIFQLYAQKRWVHYED
jgi:multiple sugar transport system permease protein